jgi:hypothetical protein
MRYSVDGKASERGARLGAIGRDHLGEFSHQFGWDYQLCHDGPRGAAASTRVAHDEKQAPA